MQISKQNPANGAENELRQDPEVSGPRGRSPAGDRQESPEQVPGVPLSEN